MKAFCPQCFTTIPNTSAHQCPSCSGPALSSGGWPMDNWLGETVDGGKYRVERLLGMGGFGRVYEVHHQLITDRILAMKVLDMRNAGARSREEQFIQEIQLLMRLNHPNIVACHEAGWLEDGSLFVLMEKIDGDELSTLLRQQKRPMSPSEAIQIGTQIAQALAAAHKHGVLHRDLKPENVMMTRDGQVRVVDFGIAKILGPDTAGQELSRVIGTPLYMAPEQFNSGERIDGRLDIYQLGAVLHFLLTGRPPFVPETGNHFAALLHIAQGQRSRTGKGGPPPSEHRPDLKTSETSQKLDLLVSKMLSYERERRPSSAQEVVQLLQQCLIAQTNSPNTPKPLPSTPANLPHADTTDLDTNAPETSPKPRQTGRRTVVEHSTDQFSPEVQKHIDAFRASASTPAVVEPVDAVTMHEHQRVPTSEDPSTPDFAYANPPNPTPTVEFADETKKKKNRTVMILAAVAVGFVVVLVAALGVGSWVLSSLRASAYAEAEDFYYGKGVERSYKRAFPLYVKACSSDIPQACIRAGLMKSRGLGTEQDREGAFAYYERACDADDPEGCFQKARALERGRGVEKDLGEAVRAYETACDAQFVSACTYLGRLCQRDKTGAWSGRDFVNLYKRACQEGDSHGCYRYGFVFEKGLPNKDINPDPSKAATYYGESCKGGYPLGCVARGSLYSKGKGGTKDAKKALQFYIKGCDGRESSGCHNASVMYKHGRGTTPDPAQAAHYTKLACSYGRKKSCE